MRRISIIGRLAGADLLERGRRSSFLVVLILALYVGYAVGSGQIMIELDGYTGVYNSAWVGTLMALVADFFLGLFGFYLVRGAVGRDRQSGLGEVLAATPVSRLEYLAGKWLSSFAILSAIVAVLMAASIFIQLIGGGQPIQTWQLLAPFLILSFPYMGFVAAAAVFFDSWRPLSGGVGNIIYLALFALMILLGAQLPPYHWLDAVGLNAVASGMKTAAAAAIPGFSGRFVLTMASHGAMNQFVWGGLDWGAARLLAHLLWFGIALVVLCAAGAVFDRFARSARRLTAKRSKLAEKQLPALPDSQRSGLRAKHYTGRQEAFRLRPRVVALIARELSLVAAGVRWYWFAALGLAWLVCVVAPSQTVRNLAFMLSALLLLPHLSGLGCREEVDHTAELIYSIGGAKTRLYIASWLSGILVTAVVTSGVLIGRLFAGETPHAASWLLSAAAIPALALFFGSATRTDRVFEAIYPVLWYLGPFNPDNQLTQIDFLGIHADATINTKPGLFAAAVAVFLILGYLLKLRRSPGS